MTCDNCRGGPSPGLILAGHPTWPALCPAECIEAQAALRGWVDSDGGIFAVLVENVYTTLWEFVAGDSLEPFIWFDEFDGADFADAIGDTLIHDIPELISIGQRVGDDLDITIKRRFGADIAVELLNPYVERALFQEGTRKDMETWLNRQRQHIRDNTAYLGAAMEGLGLPREYNTLLAITEPLPLQ